MQPNTVNTHHDTTPPVPPELLEAVARSSARGADPQRRRPAVGNGNGGAADFPTAQLRAGVAETVRRRPIAGTLRHTVVRQGAARRSAATPGGSLRSSRPAAGGSATWPLRRRLAARIDRADGDGLPAVAPQPAARRAFRAPAGAGCVPGTEPEAFFSGRGEFAEPARQVCAGCLVRAPGRRHHQLDRLWRLGRADEREPARRGPAGCAPRDTIATGRSWPLTQPGSRQAAIGRSSACPVRWSTRVLFRDVGLAIDEPRWAD